MITRNDIHNRVYAINKQCERFEIKIKNEENEYDVFFHKINEQTWKVKFQLEKTNEADSQDYTFTFMLPTTNPISLEKIAAFGLRYMQLAIQEEIQQKSNIIFEISNLLEGMVSNN